MSAANVNVPADISKCIDGFNAHNPEATMSSIGTVLSPTQSVGPDYRSESQKPTATVSTEISYESVHILPQTPQLISLMT